MSDLIDLHTHTTASDGSLTPAELVDLARREGLKALAVTDHDTVEGLDEALARGEEIGLEVVPGLEISADFKPGTMHILGYDLNHKAPGLVEKLTLVQEARRTRNPRIAARLEKLGLPVTMAEVEAAADGGQIGRPHFAKVMRDKGLVSSINEAFDRFLAQGRPAYVDKFRLSPGQALAMILEAGGQPVLAHPFSLGLKGPSALAGLLAELKEAGLVGLEVYYPEHKPDMTRDYLALAERFDLAPTGGSDYHGANKNGVRVGRGFGNLAVPYDLLVGLRRRRKAGT